MIKCQTPHFLLTSSSYMIGWFSKMTSQLFVKAGYNLILSAWKISTSDNHSDQLWQVIRAIRILKTIKTSSKLKECPVWVICQYLLIISVFTKLSQFHWCTFVLIYLNFTIFCKPYYWLHFIYQFHNLQCIRHIAILPSVLRVYLE